MTDEELCRRMRLLNEVDAFAAADRIEEMGRALQLVQTDGLHIKHARRADTAEAHLAKAVEELSWALPILERTLTHPNDEGSLNDFRAVLAEIGGGA